MPDTAPRSKSKSGSQKRQRTAALLIALTPAERADFEARAANAGLSLSAFARAAALGDKGPRARRRPTVEAATLAQTHAELRRVGNNLNQIAKALNSGHRVLVPEVQKAAEDISFVMIEIMKAFGYKTD
jgi:hypothetical protein